MYKKYTVFLLICNGGQPPYSGSNSENIYDSRT